MIFFICAPPRSGTTFLYNLLCKEKKFIYPSNFLKFFKHTLKLGFFIQNFILKKIDRNEIYGKGFYGKNPGLFSPAEIGYVYRKYLKVDNRTLYKKVSKKKIKKLIEFILSIKGNNLMIIKNFYTFNFIYEIEKLNADCKWIFLNRNINDTTRSFYKMRKKLGKEQYPITYIKKYTDDYESIKRNILEMKKKIKSQKRVIKKQNYIDINFEHLIKKPIFVVNQIKKKFLN